jgi:hypothetical protein
MSKLLALFLVLVAVAPATADMKILQPHDPTWERIFKLNWQAGEKKGQPVVEGYVVNNSPYTIGQVQLLVDALDENGNTIAQKVSWLASDAMEPFSRRYFEVPAPAPAPRYQIRVYSFDRIEGPGNRFP